LRARLKIRSFCAPIGLTEFEALIREPEKVGREKRERLLWRTKIGRTTRVRSKKEDDDQIGTVKHRRFMQIPSLFWEKIVSLSQTLYPLFLSVILFHPTIPIGN